MPILTRPLRPILLACALLASPALAQDAGQSASDLRRENDQLRERIAALEAQVEALERRVEAMREQNQRLRDALSGDRDETGDSADEGEDDAAQGEQRAEPPADPLASPSSLFNALKSSYENSRFAANPYDDARDRARYLRDVRAWVRQVEREFRGDAEWTIRVQSIEEGRGRESLVTAQVVEPSSGLPYGEAVVLPMARRYASAITNEPDVELWRISGIAAAEPAFNADRVEPGTFNTPRLIGPFAEFGFRFAVRSIEPAGSP